MSRKVTRIECQEKDGRSPVKIVAIDPQVKQARAGYREIQSEIDADDGHIWAPFRSKLDWEFARWAKLRGPTSTAVSELLAIDEVSPSHEVSLLVNTYLCIIGPRSARLVL